MYKIRFSIGNMLSLTLLICLLTVVLTADSRREARALYQRTIGERMSAKSECESVILSAERMPDQKSPDLVDILERLTKLSRRSMNVSPKLTRRELGAISRELFQVEIDQGVRDRLPSAADWIKKMMQLRAERPLPSHPSEEASSVGSRWETKRPRYLDR